MNTLKIVILICFSSIVSSCGSMTTSSYEMSKSHHLTTEVAKHLEVKILLVEKVSYDSNSIEVDYEIKNNSDKLFKPRNLKFKIFFSVLTEDGREIGHYDNFYKQIPAKSSVVLSERINLSVYKYKSVEAKIIME